MLVAVGPPNCGGLVRRGLPKGLGEGVGEMGTWFGALPPDCWYILGREGDA